MIIIPSCVRSLRRFLYLAVLSALSLSAQAEAKYPTAGGEGGKVITVTSLEDSGPGSLREALDTNEPRIVRFAVAGEIMLKETLHIVKPFVTVEGETAPSPGITIMGDRVQIRTHDVIFRHMRVHVGALLTASPPQSRRGIQIEGKLDGSDPGYNVLVENCSVAWAIDENLDVWGKNNHDIVIRNCIVAEGLANSIHPKGGTHSAALLVGPSVHNIIIQNNLFADHTYRNPVLSSGDTAFVVNNLIYNPGFAGFHFYSRNLKAPTAISVIGNVLIPGPDTSKGGKQRPELFAFDHGVDPDTKIYYGDNLAVNIKAFDPAEKLPGGAASPVVDTPPLPLGDLKPLPSSEVEVYVLAHAGARPDDRDELDKRIVQEVKDRTGSIKNFPTDPRLCPQPAVFTGVMAEYAQLVKKYVTPKGVRYSEWKKNSEDLATLQRVVDSIASSKENDLAFYLDAYNAWILHEVLKEYPLASVNAPDLHFFDGNRIKVAGQEISFDALEKEIASRFHDPRTVFALNRASRGGVNPNPDMEPFSPQTVPTQIDRLAGMFINTDKGVRVTGKEVAISRLFESHADQFRGGATSFINTYRNKRVSGSKIAFQDYDWTLNEAK